MTFIAIDPGDKQSAVVHYDPARKAVMESYYEDNHATIAWLRARNLSHSTLVIEMIASYGMPVGKEVFETCVWIGRFIEAWHGDDVHLLYRKDVKLHLCGSSRAKDPNVRAALLDKFGGSQACGLLPPHLPYANAPKGVCKWCGRKCEGRRRAWCSEVCKDRGTEQIPGQLYGISGDKWSALAVAVTWAETQTARAAAA
jgi:hypothetical protein